MYLTEHRTAQASAQGVQLTEEQTHFINMALKGYNVLTNACIGSGKTTAIQSLCSRIPTDKNVLYLTYNTLLKADAKSKIPQESTRIITNYHGFAALILRNSRQKMAGKAELIQRFNALQPELPHIDVLIIDEYQDIDEEISEMLLHIRRCNPGIQIVAVGDMNQRINNRTSLDIGNFIYNFLHNGRTFYEMSFTKCFRLSPKYAAQLGEIWGTTIRGTNRNCRVMRMTTKETAALLAEEDPKNVIVLGPNSQTPKLLNYLEKYFPEKYNKHTVYASIREEDAGVKQIAGRDCAVFTTYDGSKGLERKTCVVMDFTNDNWDYRLQKGNVSYEILRNIFLVAVSRGKERIIFVDDGKKEMLKKEKLMMRFGYMSSNSEQYNVSCMFDYKYQEDVEECYRMLDIRPVKSGDKKIEIKQNDGFIDLSPCIGNFQEADYFHYYNIDDVISHHEDIIRKEGKKYYLWDKYYKNADMNRKILFLTYLETKQERYIKQVNVPFVTPEQQQKLHERLRSRFTVFEDVQVSCGEEYYGAVIAGRADVVMDDTVYELKFVSELEHKYFLQTAVYMVIMGMPFGRLVNIKDNSEYDVSIPDRHNFMRCVVKAITKRAVFGNRIFAPAKKPQGYCNERHEPLKSSGNIFEKKNSDGFWKYGSASGDPAFAVIDVETNDKKEIMTVGIVIADKNCDPLMTGYGLVRGVDTLHSMFGMHIYRTAQKPCQASLQEIMQLIAGKLKELRIRDIFAYGSMDKTCCGPYLPGLVWHDIIKVAAYKGKNPYLPRRVEYCSTGRLKKGYKAEDIYRLVCGKPGYHEMHNALQDAVDELQIIKKIGVPYTEY